jgi:DnaJ-class molecular chaperone
MSYSQNLGHVSQLGEIRKLPKLFLQSTLNTWVTCSVCRGGGHTVTPHQNGQVDLMMCPHCKGKKKFFNGGLDG